MLLPRDLFIQVPGGDNFGHIYLDFILTIIFFYLFYKNKFIVKLLIVLITSTGIEVLQNLTTRNFSYNDIVYNFLGIYIGTIFFYLFVITSKD